METFIKKTSLGRKIHITLIVSMIIGLIIIGTTAFFSIKNIEKDVYKKETVFLNNYINDALNEKYSVGLTNVLMLSQNPILIEALATKDRKMAQIELQKYSKIFKENTKFKNIKVHIHDVDVHSFLRSWRPDKHGDDLSSFRKTVLEVKKTKKPLVAIEVGKAGPTVRGLAPMFKDGKYIGSIEFMQGFNSVVKEAKKHIDSSVVILLSKDMESIASFYKDKKVSRVDGLIVAQKPDTIDVNLISHIKDKTIQEIKKGLITDGYFIRTIPLKDFKGKTVAYAVVGKDIAIVEKTIDISVNSLVTQLIIMSVIDIVVLLSLIVIINLTIKRPLGELSELVQDLAGGGGDLTKRLPIHQKDELGEVSFYINKFIDIIEDLVSHAKTIANSNKELSQSMLDGSSELEKLSQSQVEVVNQSNQLTAEAKSDLDISEELASKTSQDVHDSYNALINLESIIDNVIDMINQDSEEENELAQRISSLANQTNDIKSVLGIIKDIADQTNLLALNAAIEAARAGEHGRGFAVVADEVRKLAEKTQKNISEIDATVMVVVQNVQDISSDMNKNSESIHRLTDKTNEMLEILETSKKSSETTKVASVESSKKTVLIGYKIKSLFEVMQKTLESTQNTKDVSNKLDNLGKTLKDSSDRLYAKLNEFKTN